jgi:hypothetical protein
MGAFNEGEVPQLILMDILQMRAYHLRVKTARLGKLIGSYTCMTEYTPQMVTNSSVNKAAAPINNKFGAYQYRVRA